MQVEKPYARAEELKALGNNSFKKKEYAQAIEKYTQAIELYDEEHTYFGNRAACYLQLKKYKLALEDCEKALKKDPTNSKYVRRKAQALLNLGNLSEARQIVQKLKESDPDDTTIEGDLQQITQIYSAFQSAQKYIDANDYKNALSSIQKVINWVPDFRDAQIIQIECLAKLAYTDQAQQQLKELQKNVGNTPDLYYLQGIIKLYAGDTEGAKRTLQEGMRMDPDNKKCLIAFKRAKRCEELKDKGNELLKNNQCDEALKSYSDALELDPYNTKLNSIIYANRGLVWSKQNNHNKAIDDFSQSIELNPEYWKAYLRRGDARVANGEFDSAQGDYQKVMQLEQSQTREMKQKIMDAQKKSKLAKKKDYYKILEVDRNSTDAQIKKAYRKLALQWHPDKNSDTEEQKKLADVKFREIAEAYSVLSDPKKKQMFDQGIDPNDPESGGGFSTGGIDPTQIFQMFFGGGGSQSQQGFPFAGFEDGGSFPFGNMGGFPGGSNVKFTFRTG